MVEVRRSSKLKGRGWWYSFFLVFLLLWFLVGLFFRVSAPDFINPAEPLKRTIFKYAFQTLLNSAPVFLMLALGYGLAGEKKNYIYKGVISWLFVVGLGVFLAVGLLLKDNQFNLSNFYDALLPITRNSYPFISGLLFGLLSLPIVYKLTEGTDVRYFVLVYLVVFLIPTLFNQDFLNFQGGQSAIFYWLIFVIGVVLRQMPVIRYKKAHAVGLLVTLFLAFSLILVMPYASYNIYASLKSADRFAHPASFFVLTSIVGIFYGFVQGKCYELSDFMMGLILGVVVLSKTVSAYAQVVDWISSHLALGYSRILLATLIVAVLTVVIALAFSAFTLGVTHRKRSQLASRLFGKPVFSSEVSGESVQKLVLIFLKKHSHTIIFGLVSYALAISSFFLMNFSRVLSNGMLARRNAFIYEYFGKHGMVILTTILIFALFGLLRGLTNRFWLSSIITTIAVLIFTLASRMKMKLRGEPIYPSEVDIKTFPSLLEMIPIQMLVVSVIALAFLIGLMVFLEYKKPVKGQSLVGRLISVTLSLLLFSSAFSLNTEESRFNTLFTAFGDSRLFEVQNYGARVNGPIIQFLNNVDVDIMEKPDGYAKEKIQSIVKKYDKLSQETNQNRRSELSDQNVIFILSESFSDVARVPELSVQADAIPYIRQLKQITTSGLMMSSHYGGGSQYGVHDTDWK